MLKQLLFIAITILFCACKSAQVIQHHTDTKTNIATNPSTDFLDSLMQTKPEWFAEIMQKADDYRVKIIYTKIDRDADNHPYFTEYSYHNNEAYFYPASTIKFPLSLLALEKINGLDVPGVNMNTPMITDTSFVANAHYTQPSAVNSAPSIANYIKQILLVSDNDASNQLYEFLGQEAINEKLHTKGYTSVEIRHRLQIARSAAQNRITNPVYFTDSNGTVIYKQTQQQSKYFFPKRNDFIGKGYIGKNDAVVYEPFDFSQKNKFELSDLTQILKAIIFPEAMPANKRFNLTQSDYRFLHHYMSAWPRESSYPGYSDTSYYYDAYCKFLLLGSEKASPQKGIRIFNKVGDAYGFLTDIAYIVDFENNIEFMLSATIYCNSDGIFNDDKYDYDSIGFPFMKHIGQLIYDYEVNRSRLYKPDLQPFKFDYSE